MTKIPFADWARSERTVALIKRCVEFERAIQDYAFNEVLLKQQVSNLQQLAAERAETINTFNWSMDNYVGKSALAAHENEIAERDDQIDSQQQDIDELRIELDNQVRLRVQNERELSIKNGMWESAEAEIERRVANVDELESKLRNSESLLRIYKLSRNRILKRYDDLREAIKALVV